MEIKMVPSRPRARADLTVAELDGEAVVYDPASKDLHHLNATATIVFACCDGTMTPREIAAEISGAFGIAAQELEPQVDSLIRDLIDLGLMEARPIDG